MADFQVSESSVGAGDRWALLIETDVAYRAAMAECLQLGGCCVDQVSSLDSAFAALAERRFDLVVWGGATVEAKGSEAAAGQLRSHFVGPLLLVDGGFDTPEVAVAVEAEHWLPKPFIPGALVEAVRAALRRSDERGSPAEWRDLSAAQRREPQAAPDPPADGGNLADPNFRAADVTPFGPSGGPGRAWEVVKSQLGPLGLRFQSGSTREVLAEHVSGDLACTVEIVCCEELIAGNAEPLVVDLRVTIVYRRESGAWKIVHRHADRLLDPVAGAPGQADAAREAGSDGGTVRGRSHGGETSGARSVTSNANRLRK
jgi:DNA-binding NarL/FixJ family response regulator